jgi:hypothetical protein
MKKRELFRLLIIGCLLVLVASGAVFAAGRGKAYGTLISIEPDSTVVIKDNNGQLNTYLVSPKTIVQRNNGKQVWLDRIRPESYIYFEYEYTTNGFMIVFIKEIPK